VHFSNGFWKTRPFDIITILDSQMLYVLQTSKHQQEATLLSLLFFLLDIIGRNKQQQNMQAGVSKSAAHTGYLICVCGQIIVIILNYFEATNLIVPL
jgi:hypothetical protein